MRNSRVLSDIVLALFVIAIIAMLIIPLPTFLLDILIVINISFALLLLLVGLYMPNALALLSFPTLLLLTTLFRLGLNVASTRLILSQGNAGRVIQAFGTFLVRGEVLVGVIIFTIITIVNFIVIARGSSRVSVVAARFTLDSLPGKQAAIDSDLRAGLINNEDASRRREDLRKESQLYGAMDGAMQFVQGDAIAGFFIILTNIFGGIYLGISKGQTFSEALNTYTILTVGDGLVTQIPALLISICAGIVVTRVSSGERATLSADLASQLFSNPLTLIISGIILLLLGAMPGLPFFPFFLVSIMFFITSLLLRKKSGPSADSRLLLDYQGGGGFALAMPQGESTEDENIRNVQIYLDKSVGYKIFAQKEQQYYKFWNKMRDDFFNDVGLRLPDIKVLPDEYQSAIEYSVRVAGSVIEQETLVLDVVMVEINPDFSYLYNLKVVKEELHPVSKQRVFWTVNSDHSRQILDAAGIRGFDFFEFICLKTAVFYANNPQEVVTISEVHAQLKQLEKKYPGLVADVLARNFLDIPRLSELLQMLVKQSVNIKDFRQIVELVASYCSSNAITASDVDSAVLNDIVIYIKQHKFKHQYASSRLRHNSMRVFTLNAEAEAVFEENSAQDLIKDQMSPLESLKNNLMDILKPVFNRGLLPLSLLIRPDLRSNLESFMSFYKLPVQIVTFDELESDANFERIAVWRI
jgi:type III secretion protein V